MRVNTNLHPDTKVKTVLISASFAAVAALGLSCDRAFAQFPSAGMDMTTSLGMFKIVINPAFQPVLQGASYPGYDSTTHRLSSPLLFDPSTTISRSDPIVAGTPAYLAGAANLTVFPTGFAAPTPPTRVVDTQITSVNLTTGVGGAANPHVYVGMSPNLTLASTYGEVISQSSSGLPANDFPAQSFFDVFVDVQLPGLGVGGAPVDLINATPLLVMNTNLSAFPPTVVYTHGNSTAVALTFTADDPAIGAVKGDTFGLLTLAGHGVGYGDNPTDIQNFNNAVGGMQEAPVPPDDQNWGPGLMAAPEMPSGSRAVGVGLLAGATVWRLRRRAIDWFVGL